ncbi:MAG TPA: aminodeoxychorismate/anthranilate synthase component II [Anaerolineales bacterium]|nr:aminodeoxychorismate/anthranilate synthase component II [Anaerolineales bacterium]
MIAIIDNYDSFTYNLVQLIGELGIETRVFRNDAITTDELEALDPSRIIISPGPGDPSDAGISNEVIRRFGESRPILGVCLGQQCIAAVYGGRVIRAAQPVHGKTSRVWHDGSGVFHGLPNPVEAMRYHSLVVELPLPDVLEAIATTSSGELMALRHRIYPIFGVQFHPESILTPAGKQMLANFIGITQPARLAASAPN